MNKIKMISKLKLVKLLDSIPFALFIVNKKNEILDLNQYATTLIDKKYKNTIRRLCGDVFHCIHAINSPQGCGKTEFCSDCVINTTINESCSGKTIVKRKAEVLTEKEGRQVKSVFLISAFPYEDKENNFTILSLEDISEIVILKNLLPICSECKKIRDDKGYWKQLETYIEMNSDASFSHGICPECSDNLYGDQDWYVEMRNKKKF